MLANSDFTCGGEDQGRGLSTDFKDRRAEGRTTSAVMKEQSGKKTLNASTKKNVVRFIVVIL